LDVVLKIVVDMTLKIKEHNKP